MKSINFLFVVAALLVCNTSYAQSTEDNSTAVELADSQEIMDTEEVLASATDKQKARAEALTENLNERIITSDASLALSEEQKNQITELYLKRVVDRAKLIEAGVARDEVKIQNKEFVKSTNRLINKILSKDQKAASRAAKK